MVFHSDFDVLFDQFPHLLHDQRTGYQIDDGAKLYLVAQQNCKYKQCCVDHVFCQNKAVVQFLFSSRI